MDCFKSPRSQLTLCVCVCVCARVCACTCVYVCVWHMTMLQLTSQRLTNCWFIDASLRVKDQREVDNRTVDNVKKATISLWRYDLNRPTPHCDTYHSKKKRAISPCLLTQHLYCYSTIDSKSKVFLIINNINQAERERERERKESFLQTQGTGHDKRLFWLNFTAMPHWLSALFTSWVIEHTTVSLLT